MPKANEDSQKESPFAVSKAVAKLAVRAVEPTISETGGAVANIARALFSDPVREWRTRRLVDLLERTHKHLHSKGISIEKAKSLPNGAAYAIFENATLVDDERVEDLWSRLIANAMDGQHDLRNLRAYIDILNSIGANEAILLDGIWKIKTELMDPYEDIIHFLELQEYKRPSGFDENEIRRTICKVNDYMQLSWRNIHPTIREISAQNLIRLRCISLRLPTINANATVELRHKDPNYPYRIIEDELLRTLQGFEAYSKFLKGESKTSEFGAVGRFQANTIDGLPLPEDIYCLTALGEGLMQAIDVSNRGTSKEGLINDNRSDSKV